AAGGNAVDDLHAADLDQPVAGGGIKAGRLRVQHDLAQHPRPQALDAHTRMPLARSWATLWTRSLGLHALAKRPVAIFLAIFLGAMLLVDACGLLFSALMLVGAHACWGLCFLDPCFFGPCLAGVRGPFRPSCWRTPSPLAPSAIRRSYRLAPRFPR